MAAVLRDVGYPVYLLRRACGIHTIYLKVVCPVTALCSILITMPFRQPPWKELHLTFTSDQLVGGAQKHHKPLMSGNGVRACARMRMLSHRAAAAKCAKLYAVTRRSNR